MNLNHETPVHDDMYKVNTANWILSINHSKGIDVLYN